MPFLKGNQMRKTHGHTPAGFPNSPTYNTWRSMIQRCTNPNHGNYEYYGGRGIEIAEGWFDFEYFLSDMGVRPEGTTLDRYPDCNGNYELENCRWATKKEQDNNRNSTVLFSFRGEVLSKAQWADRFGMSRELLHYRLSHNWTTEQALTTPRGERRK